VAADTAAELIMRRFAAPGSSGLLELLRLCDNLPRPLKAAAAAAAVAGQSSDQQQQQQQQAAWPPPPLLGGAGLTGEQIEEVAAQLASIVDRAQQLPEAPGGLQAVHFVPQVLQQAVLYIADAAAAAAAATSQSRQDSSGSAKGSSGSTSQTSNDKCWIHSQNAAAEQSLPSSSAAAVLVPGAVALASCVLQKFISRGHGKHAAAALWQLLQRSCHPEPSLQQQSQLQMPPAAAVCAAVQQILQHMAAHPKPMEKLLVLLLTAASTWSPSQHTLGQQHQLDPTQANQQQQQQQQQASTLAAVLCPLLLQAPKVYRICLHRLLLVRTLPWPSLLLLLLLLRCCRPSLLPEAALQLATAWADRGTVLQAPVPQQAYLTAALAECLAQLPRELLDPACPAAAAAAAASYDTAVAATAAQQLVGLIPSVLQVRCWWCAPGTCGTGCTPG
jgi:hypothetical protein